jgi:hypothetical protein
MTDATDTAGAGDGVGDDAAQLTQRHQVGEIAHRGGVLAAQIGGGWMGIEHWA